MRQRPRDPEPQAGRPRPRDIRPHWTDQLTRLAGIAATGLVIVLAAANRGTT